MHFLFLLLAPIIAAAQPNNSIEDAMKGLLSQLFNGDDDPEDSLTSTSHTIETADGTFDYTAVTGLLPQYDDAGQKLGEMFFTAYLKEDYDPTRPLTFVFNGGPGGSSLSMHIAGFGPRRLLYPEEGQGSKSPFHLIDNPQTILNLTDIVMVDPIGTGYSKTDNEAYESFAFGVEGDIVSFAEFIRVFCVQFDRWTSPKYLIGASYGTCRACGLAEDLMASSGIYLDGIILLGSALDMNTIFPQRDLYLSECLKIPTYAATAWYHGRTNHQKSLQETVDFARRFAMEDYAPAMAEPTRLTKIEQKAFYQQLAELIGLPETTIARYQGRITEEVYVTEFKAQERKVIGGIDSRYEGDISTVGHEYFEDPSYRNFRPAFAPAFMQYLQEELQTGSIINKYKNFSVEALYRWDWRMFDAGYQPTRPNFLQRLRRTLVANPTMQVFIGSGYYDIRTPFAAVEYSIDHLELPESYRSNFQFEYYEAGHGFIFDLASLEKLKVDLTQFYNDRLIHNSKSTRK